MGSRSNRTIVPASRQALHQMKYEIAAELGLVAGPASGSAGGHGNADTEFAGELGGTPTAAYVARESWSHMATRETGAVGGEMTRRLIRQAEQTLRGLH
ncbi:alpha/beta-type small acid-soluble spore protein [Paenibacillaceae bacterium]|nr:alpha/beta-type small acid-soluble spore protein [Paenibacillaceae bacterium]